MGHGALGMGHWAWAKDVILPSGFWLYMLDTSLLMVLYSLKAVS
jgi:hypothetical protein